MTGLALERRGWRREERGWWTHDHLGGVCVERDGKWHAYPRHAPEATRIETYPTLAQACAALEEDEHGANGSPDPPI